jgi:hypothetical protein
LYIHQVRGREGTLPVQAGVVYPHWASRLTLSLRVHPSGDLTREERVGAQVAVGVGGGYYPCVGIRIPEQDLPLDLGGYLLVVIQLGFLLQGEGRRSIRVGGTHLRANHRGLIP